MTRQLSFLKESKTLAPFKGFLEGVCLKIRLESSGFFAENVPTFELNMSGDMGIVDFLVNINLFQSKSDARRMIEQGGIQIDGKKITDWKSVVVPADEIMVQKGKKTFLRVVNKN